LAGEKARLGGRIGQNVRLVQVSQASRLKPTLEESVVSQGGVVGTVQDGATLRMRDANGGDAVHLEYGESAQKKGHEKKGGDKKFQGHLRKSPALRRADLD
jgi:hypothetical protein